MGRSERLHRGTGGYGADRRPGILEEEFPKVVRGNAGRSIAGRHGEPSGHHTILRAGKGKEYMDTKTVATRMERVLQKRNGGIGKNRSSDTAKYASDHQHGGI